MIGYTYRSLWIPGKCKDSDEDEITPPMTTDPLDGGRMTSPVQCAHECRKKHKGDCPFALVGLTYDSGSYLGDSYRGTATRCVRSKPRSSADCTKRSGVTKAPWFIHNTRSLGKYKML